MDFSIITTVLLFLLGALGTTALLYLKSQNSDLRDKIGSLERRFEKMEDREQRQTDDFDDKLRRLEDNVVSNQVFAMALDNINTNQKRFFDMLSNIDQKIEGLKTDIKDHFPKP